MKTLRIAILLLAITGFALASTLTIEIPAADDPRIAEAYGSILNLKDVNGQPRPATTTEIQSAVIAWINQSTQDYEKRKNMATFSPPPLVLNSPVELPPPSPGMRKAATATPKPKKK